MLSINTNLAGLIAQNSMKTSTDKLNQAIERMTTGLKINHAKDNAANYSISTNLTTQLSAYDTAADNVAMGMDLVNYASDIISQMQDKAARLNALSTQARNGTYGAQSLSALNSEANAIMSELMRLYSTAEYNDISLFNRKDYELTADHKALTESLQNNVVAKEEYNGFIVDPVTKEQSYVDALSSVSSVTQATGFIESEYKVASVEDLVKLAELTNAGVDTSGKTFYLANDLDIGAYCEAHMADGGWTPIGYSTSTFKGIFDGNGHVIKNLKIDRETSDYQGLFGNTEAGEIKNIGLENVSVKGQRCVGGLVGSTYNNSSVNNCYATGEVFGCSLYVAGLIGISNGASEITNCYTIVNVTSEGNNIGGLVGYIRGFSTLVSNNYSLSSVNGLNYVGGLVGQSHSAIENSYATGDVSGTGNYVGGLVGEASNSSSISNSYATGNVSGTGDYVGGLAGSVNNTISNSYATGKVSGTSSVGGLVGSSYSSISNSYATGAVTGTDKFVGGLVGRFYAANGTYEITNSVSYSTVKGNDSASTGSLIGGAVMTYNGTSFGTLNITNSQSIAQNGVNSIGGAYHSNGTAITYDLSPMLAGITDVAINKTSTDLQVGIYGNDSSRMNFDTNFSFDLNLDAGIESVEAFDAIVAFENLLSEKATQLGAVQNRLESALESIEVNINNLTSTRSTIRDADIAEVSSHYIQQQILQQAAATLMATANQAPSIALQLI